MWLISSYGSSSLPIPIPRSHCCHDRQMHPHPSKMEVLTSKQKIPIHVRRSAEYVWQWIPYRSEVQSTRRSKGGTLQDKMKSHWSNTNIIYSSKYLTRQGRHGWRTRNTTRTRTTSIALSWGIYSAHYDGLKQLKPQARGDNHDITTRETWGKQQ